MSVFEILATVYLAFGTLIACILLPACEPPEYRVARGTLKWWVGGMTAGLICAFAWLPIIMFRRAK